VIDIAFAIPGNLDAATGGYAYARKVLQLLAQNGINCHHLELPGSFPNPTGDDLTLTRRLLDQIHPETPILFDGLALGALPPGFLTGLEPPIVALVHHPLAMETGLSATRAQQLMESERDALSHARAIIATSPTTAQTLAATYSVTEARLSVAEPGTAAAERAIGTGMPFMMLGVGALIPRKGYSVLVDALHRLDRDDWELTLVGSPDHDPTEANRIREKILASGMRGRITLAGRLPGAELARLYASADLFILPSLYEGYGMVLAEAMARGLAIVCTTGGAAAKTAPDDAAIKVPPNDAVQLSSAIAHVMADEALSDRLSDASWAAGQALSRWPDTVCKIADVLKNIHKEQAL
jgi:glycosyltransferase involved in cell wall biosynthesis